MKRIGNLYDKIANLDNCILAAKNAIKHKKKLNRVDSMVFSVAANPAYYGYKVYEMLRDKTFVPSDPDHFIIYEGIKKKRREIYAPKLFPDQIVHWAIIQVIQEDLLKSFYYYSCGSVPGKGPALVKKYLTKELSIDTVHHKHVRKTYKYCLKLDIHHFFQSIDVDIMMSILNGIYKDKDMLDIFESIVRAPNKGPGLPIGFYTSQWLANVYLTKFDHWLVRRLSKSFNKFIYIRYVDDIVIVGSNKRELSRVRQDMSDYLHKELHLSLKYDSDDQIFDIGKRDIDFVGFRFTYGKTTVRNSIYRNAMNAERTLNESQYTEKGLARVISYDGWIDSSDCFLEKQKRYKYDTKFYKYKLHEFQTSSMARKRAKNILKLQQIKTSLIKANETNMENGYIYLFDVIKENGEYKVAVKDVIKMREG